MRVTFWTSCCWLATLHVNHHSLILNLGSESVKVEACCVIALFIAKWRNSGMCSPLLVVTKYILLVNLFPRCTLNSKRCLCVCVRSACVLQCVSLESPVGELLLSGCEKGVHTITIQETGHGYHIPHTITVATETTRGYHHHQGNIVPLRHCAITIIVVASRDKIVILPGAESKFRFRKPLQ